MEWLHAAWFRLKTLFRRRRLDQDLQDELAFHLAMRQEMLRAEGMIGPEARHASRRMLGNEVALRETIREQWTFVWLETLVHDLRYAFRTLRRSPGLTAVIVVSLALGIGANTAIFSLLNAALLRVLPVPEPEKLMLLTWSAEGWPERVMEGLEGTSRHDERAGRSWSWSFSSEIFDYVRDHNRVFDSTISFAANSDRANIGLDGRAEVAQVQAVSGNFFQGLRVAPLVGRSLLPEDDTESAPPVAMISYGFWRSRMGGSNGVVGRTVVVNGQSVTVVGVLPPEFFGVEPGSRPEVWVTLSQYALALARVDNYDIRQPGVWWLGVIGRMKSGVSETQARAEMKALFDQALRIRTPNLPHDGTTPEIDLMPAARGLDRLRYQFSSSLMLLMGMVGLVLLIACANVSGLLLARGAARQREIALRLSLGAPRLRVVRQLLTESILLGALGGAAGLAAADWVSSFLVMLIDSGRNAVSLPLHLDATVLAFTAAISVLCGLAFGIAPALRATRVNYYPVLKQGPGDPRRNRFLSGKSLVAGQVALCLLLLISAGLLLRTLDRLQQVDLGFDHRHMLTFRVQPALNGYKGQRLAGYYEDLQRRIQAVPGVRAVSFSQLGPVGSGSSSTSTVLPGYSDPDKRVILYRHWIGPGYLETLGIPVILGRGLNGQDDESRPQVAVVNQRAVRDYFHGDNPIGRSIETGPPKDPSSWTIVGVVGDVKYNSIRETAPPTVYFPYRQRPGASSFFMTYLVQASGNPLPLMADLRRAGLAVDKDVPLLDLRTEAEVIDRVFLLERIFAVLSSSFGVLALLLACVGLYGTIAYTVARRRQEIGIRMALGAAREALLLMVLRETLRVVAAGIAAGLPLAWVATRLLKSRLFDLSPHDPATITVSLLTILVVTLTAGFLPARRAGRVDPVAVLRCE